ncbi:MAG: NUDIX hydrolase [Pseudomonadota bacterium]
MSLKNIPIEKLDKMAAKDGSQGGKNMRPKDSSTLIILDGEPGDFKVLMGRRHMNHKFMPGKFVFPGGRVDRFDGSAPSLDELDPNVEAHLLREMRGRPTNRRARALAMASIRETFEEAGLFIGKKGDIKTSHQDWCAFRDLGLGPTLSHLRYIARAITPPGRPRRFDARFFVTFADQIGHRFEGELGPSNELQELHWIGFDDARNLELPVITKTIIDDLEKRLQDDPDLDPSIPVPFYHLVGKTFRRDLI